MGITFLSRDIDVSKYARQFGIGASLGKLSDKIAGGIEDIASKLNKIDKDVEGMFKTIKNRSNNYNRAAATELEQGHLYINFAVQL